MIQRNLFQLYAVKTALRQIRHDGCQRGIEIEVTTELPSEDIPFKAIPITLEDSLKGEQHLINLFKWQFRLEHGTPA